MPVLVTMKSTAAQTPTAFMAMKATTSSRAMHPMTRSGAVKATIRLTAGRRTTASMAVTATTRSSAATATTFRSEEHTSELQSLMRISYAVFCLKKKKKIKQKTKDEKNQSLKRHPITTIKKEHK